MRSVFTFNLAAQMSSKRDATIYRKSGRELAKTMLAVGPLFEKSWARTYLSFEPLNL